MASSVQSLREPGRRATRAAAAGPLVGLFAQVLLLAGLAATVGLGVGGWVAGLTCAIVVNVALANGLARHRSDGLGPADRVTLARASLAIGVGALVADSFAHRVPVAPLVGISALALALDYVDGWIARRTRTTAMLGAQFDGEVDAFLILILSVYVARSAGAWVLAIGAARYAFLAAGWPLPWMRAPLPPRYWRKVVTATQGIVLTIAATGVLPRSLTQAIVLVALVLLGESFGRDVLWLWMRRQAARTSVGADTTLERAEARSPTCERAGIRSGRAGATLGRTEMRSPARGRLRTCIATALTALALLIVWAALVAPDRPEDLTPTAFLRVPLDGLALIAVGALLPRIPRRILAALAGPLLGLVVILKILDIGFFTAFARPFDPVGDLSNIGTGIETLQAAIGSSEANLIVVGGVTLTVAVLVLTTLALFRLMRVAAEHRRSSLRAVMGLGAIWLLFAVSGAQLLSGTPVASTSTASYIGYEVRTVQADIHDAAVFAKQIRNGRFRSIPGNQLLTGLRGKDVLLVFVESYGQVSVQGSSFAPAIDALLDRGTRQLRTAGFSARSAFVDAPGFGGMSWLGHSTLQSGVWVNSQRRYDQLVGTHRFTLTEAFDRAGWRTISFAPADDRDWPEGSSFYHYGKLYDRRDMGYRGPGFTYAPLPDQYMFAALQRLVLSKPHGPLFAEVDTVSSHMPWTRIPRQIPWNEVGDGSIFDRVPMYRKPESFWWHPDQVKAAYDRSLEYSLKVLISYVQHYGKKNLVLVVVGDEQPLAIVSGTHASHDVPISIIAHDPSVLERIKGWGWQAGLLPSPHAPVWPMSAVRNRFLTAYGPPR
jgi:phosphatidylglycerophosphate synthase